MSGFYVSLIFFGILLILFSLICIFLDKKKVFIFNRSFEEKKQQLVEIINDADQMIEELNKFSDYIVNQMDLKNEELEKNLKDAEERVNALNCRARSAVVEADSVISETITGQTSATVNTFQDTGAVLDRSRVSAAINESAVEPVAAVSDETAAVQDSSAIHNVKTASGAAAIGAADSYRVKAAVGGGYSIITEPVDEASEHAVNSRTNDIVHPSKMSARRNDKVIPINNKYSEVIRLSQEGLHGSEIAKRLKLGKGEVELILDLRK